MLTRLDFDMRLKKQEEMELLQQMYNNANDLALKYGRISMKEWIKRSQTSGTHPLKKSKS